MAQKTERISDRFVSLAEHQSIRDDGYIFIGDQLLEDGTFMYFGEIPKNLQTLPWGVDTNRKDFNVYFIYDPQRIEAQVSEGERHLVAREKRRLEREGWRVRMDSSERSSRLLAIRGKNLSSPKST